MSFGAGSSNTQSSAYSQSLSENLSQATSQSGQNVWEQQAPALQDLYSRASGGVDRAIAAQQQMMPAMESAGRELMAVGQGNDPALQAYMSQVGENFQNSIMPQIQGQAGLHGAVGGGRQGVAQGVAAGMANRDIQRFAGQQYQQGQDRRLATLQSMPGLNQMFQQPFSNYAQQIGGPAVMGYSSSDAYSQGRSRSQGASESFGSSFNFGGGLS